MDNYNNFFNQDFDAWIPMNNPVKQPQQQAAPAKSAEQLLAEKIAQAMGSNGLPVLGDATEVSPFWLDGELVLVSSDKTTAAETLAIVSARKAGNTINIVEFDPKTEKITHKETLTKSHPHYNDFDDLSIPVTAAVKGGVDPEITYTDPTSGQKVTKKFSALTPAEKQIIQDLTLQQAQNPGSVPKVEVRFPGYLGDTDITGTI